MLETVLRAYKNKLEGERIHTICFPMYIPSCFPAWPCNRTSFVAVCNNTKESPLLYLLHRCKRNCKRKVDTNAKMAFEGICIGDVCKEANTKYTWSLYRKRDGSVVKTRNNKDIRLLEIEGGVLDEGEDYELKLDGYLTEEINSSQTHTFTTNESPSGGNCTVNKREGVVLETNFTFTCFAWKDNDRELTYQFGYTSNTGAHEIIHEGPLSFLKTNKLPLGDPEKDYEIRVDIYIKDMWGGFGKKSVTVRVSLGNLLLPGSYITKSVQLPY